MKNLTNIRILAALLAVATYVLIGPHIAYFSSEISNKFNVGDFSLLHLLSWLPLLAVFFIYRYGYKVQMKFLSSSCFKNYLERRYDPNAEKFAKGLIPVSIVIVILSFFIAFKSNFNFSLLNLKDFETLNFYVGLILVIINFYPKNP